jgi:hypothetical protein
MTKKICPRCFGNGYIKVFESIDKTAKQIVVQCTLCDSEGELKMEDTNGGERKLRSNKTN